MDTKTRKLKKLFAKYQELKGEIDDEQEMFAQEREDMMDSIRTLTRQMKLKNTVIENFIPPEEVGRMGRNSCVEVMRTQVWSSPEVHRTWACAV